MGLAVAFKPIVVSDGVRGRRDRHRPHAERVTRIAGRTNRLYCLAVVPLVLMCFCRLAAPFASDTIKSPLHAILGPLPSIEPATMDLAFAFASGLQVRL